MRVAGSALSLDQAQRVALACLASLASLLLGACERPSADGASPAERAAAPTTSVSPSLPPAVPPAAPAPTAPTAPPAPTAAARSGDLRVLLTGDVIAHRPVLIHPGALARALGPLAPLFGSADGVLVNHESSTGATPTGHSREAELAYAAPPFWASELAGAHVSAIGLANNHACDLGREGLLATVASAQASKLGVVGAGEAPWRAQVIASREGHDVCAVAWSTLTNGDPRTCEGSLAYAPLGRAAERKVGDAIAEARTRCAAVVAVVHLGQEYKAQPPSVYALGARLAEAGADAVVVHHPHIVSPLKTATTADGRHVPIFASVGNLVTNQGYAWRAPNPVVLPDRLQVSANAWTRVGMIAELSVTPAANAAPNARPRVRYGYHLVWNDKPKLERRGSDEIVARRVSPEADATLLERFARDGEGPNAVFRSPCWIRDGKATATCEGALEPRGPTARAPRR